ncbi:MAG: serine/threonine protein kinase [Oscillospiraceae bacterium]|nr:serine/threonine protein kinase [Oscillospiraceae bacterium]
MEHSEICYTCFRRHSSEVEICPYCGAVRDPNPREAIHLRPGTLLGGRYLLGYAEGAGGFGIIYRAWDTKLESIVAVKEFFVNRLMTRAAGEAEVIINRKAAQEFEYRKERFLAEARTMAKFGNHRNIPNVFEFFEENGTAYIVMELLEGQPLNEYLRDQGGKISQDFAVMITNEVGKALTAMHEHGIVHRDVAPDNIYICSNDELRIKLLDLGAAKLADSTDDVVDIILKPGYSPVEQYDKTASIGPWSDVYALGASLYVMLTGVKPEEATNRKINDSVQTPQELDPSIPENLSNAVMKAMAVERNLRFKTVEDFLKAINGEKKIIPLKKERRRRARRRYLGITAAVLALALISAYVYHMYSDKRAVQVLPDAAISVWYAVEEGSSEEAAMERVLADFRETFPNVEITGKAIPAADYAQQLQQAQASGQMPTLFESTGLDQALLAQTADLSPVLASEQAADCLFLDQYDKYYSNRTQIPLAIQVPVAYVITSGSVSVDYQGSTFRSLSDFGQDTAIALEDDSEVTGRNFNLPDPADPAGFWDNETNSCAVLLSTNMAANRVRAQLTSYEKRFVYYAADRVYCGFDYEWSIGAQEGPEREAAMRLLSWMLGNRYQNLLMISMNAEGQIPVNRECFGDKTAQQNYGALQEIYKNYYFLRQR